MRQNGCTSLVKLTMPQAPLLWPSVVTPEPEIAAVKDLYAHLVGLQYSVDAWEAGLVLYVTTKHPPASVSATVARRWRFIACNECILELYHLRSRLAKIQAVKLRNCPSIRTLVDMAQLRSARKRLDDDFPDIEALRHATAHRGENEAHDEIHAPDGLFALSGFREPDRYSTPYEGKLRYLDINNESLTKISIVVSEYLRAFEPAAAELQTQGHLE